MTDIHNRAYALGIEAGENAASWVFDGNTTRETYESLLKGIEDGDPMVYDLLGIHVPSITQEEVAEELDLEYPSEPPHVLNEAWCDWEAGINDGFWQEIERMARYQLED